jgi:hypothetical protein
LPDRNFPVTAVFNSVTRDQVLPVLHQEIEGSMKLANLLIRLRGTDAIADPEVAQALRLTDTQKIRIHDVQRLNSLSLRERIRSLLHGPRTVSLRESLQELRRESEQSVISQLNGEQRARYSRLRSS